MFKDRQEELERLEAELLQEEPAEEDIPEEEDLFGEEIPEIYRNHAKGYGKIHAYNTDVTDGDLERFSEEVREPKKHTDVLVLCAVAMCLITGIIGVLCWWAVRFLGR